MEDRERERLMLNDDSVRHLNLPRKELPERYGLWDHVYDRRVIRTLDCNAQWTPNRRENERRKRERIKREKQLAAAKRRDEEQAETATEEQDPFAESRKKWFSTGKATWTRTRPQISGVLR